MKKKLLIGLATGIFLVGMFGVSQAAFINWTDWTGVGDGQVVGSMDGVGVTYTGNIAFTQLGTGINYWAEGTPAPYTGNSLIDNAPTASELVATDYAGLKTVTFSEAVLNPIMAIVSQGRTNLPVSYDFDTPFSVLSEGRGYWGDGWYTLGAGDVLNGYEFHGAIQFQGLLTSISWFSQPDEYWHGFNIGVADSVPEPATMLLLGTSLVGLAGTRLRRKKNA